MKDFTVKSIGEIRQKADGFEIKLQSELKEGLVGLEGYSWVNIIWWFNQLDGTEYRNILVAEKPYKKGPAKMGVFGTRSPMRPNPIAITPVYVEKIDYSAGIIFTPYIDAEDQSPLLDIKPYIPSADIVAHYDVPEWCYHWPRSMEESADFNWAEEFNF